MTAKKTHHAHVTRLVAAPGLRDESYVGNNAFAQNLKFQRLVGAERFFVAHLFPVGVLNVIDADDLVVSKIFVPLTVMTW